MYFKSKKISLIILGITAIICSKVLFFLFNDPEGPNLLIIAVAAVVIFFLSQTVYLLNLSMSSQRRLLLAICIQAILTIGFYFCFY